MEEALFPTGLESGSFEVGLWQREGRPFLRMEPTQNKGLERREGDMGSLTSCKPWTQSHRKAVLHLAFLLPEPITVPFLLRVLSWWILFCLFITCHQKSPN